MGDLANDLGPALPNARPAARIGKAAGLGLRAMLNSFDDSADPHYAGCWPFDLPLFSKARMPFSARPPRDGGPLCSRRSALGALVAAPLLGSLAQARPRHGSAAQTPAVPLANDRPAVATRHCKVCRGRGLTPL